MRQNSQSKIQQALGDKKMMEQIANSPDAQRLMELLNANAGGNLKSAADAAAKGDPAALAGLLSQVMHSEEGAQVVERLSGTVPKTAK